MEQTENSIETQLSEEDRQAIEMYMTDESKRYEDWYKGLQTEPDDPYTTPVGKMPSIESIKKRFGEWFKRNRDSLRDTICVKWEYRIKREKFQKKNSLIIAIIVDGIAIHFGIPTTNTITIVTILVVDGYLDDLCADSCEG